MSIHAAAPAHEQVAALAYSYYEAEGRPEGRAEAHWLRALETLAVPAVTEAAAAKPKAKAPAKKAAKAKG
ncbi:MAG: DUF2934 domain-containing protein [Alphaproteobacteria bacterium]|nr:DUF2934 domain-containing protein [Alphaproteobacteria bacterium]